MSISLDQPIVVASGHDARSTLRVHNHQNSTQVVLTNGYVTARVIDPHTGQVVGGYTGARRLPRVTYEIRPGRSETIPLLVATASRIVGLGYAIPPGEWAIDAILALERGQYRTPRVPLRVVESSQ